MDGAQASQISNPLRELVALAVVSANAVLLLVGFIDLLIPSAGTTFTSRSGAAYFDFAGIEGIVLPVLAVLLATHIQPAVPRAKQITTIAVGEYAVSAFFGVIALFTWLIGRLADGAFRDAFTGLLVRVAYVAIFAAAAFVVFRIWATLYYTPGERPHQAAYGRARAAGQPADARQGGESQPHGQQPGNAQAQQRTQTYGQQGGYAHSGGYAQPSEYAEPGDYRRPTDYGQARVVQPSGGPGSGESPPTDRGQSGQSGQPGPSRQSGQSGQPGQSRQPGQSPASAAQQRMAAPPPAGSAPDGPRQAQDPAGSAPSERAAARPDGRGDAGDDDPNAQTQEIEPVRSAAPPPAQGEQPPPQPGS